MSEQIKNSAASVLAANIGSGDGSLTVTTGQGANFPTSGDFRIIVGNEVMICTARTADTLTVTRGAEGSSAAAHTAGDAVTHILTAGGLTQFIADKVNGIAVSAVEVTRSTSLSTTNSTWTSVGWDTESWDTDGYHDNVTNNNRLTIPVGFGGKFLVIAGYNFTNTSTTGIRAAQVEKNTTVANTNVIAQGFFLPAGGITNMSSFSRIVSLADGDWINVNVFQNSGGALNFNSEGASFLSLSRLGT